MMEVTMRAILVSMALACGLALSAVAQTAAPSVTASCKDGTSQTGASRQVVCKSHGGIAPEAARTPVATPAPGGGPGLVWVNPVSHVYHCATDRAYGTTKRGSYMTEDQAKAAGSHAKGGKACS